MNTFCPIRIFKNHKTLLYIFIGIVSLFFILKAQAALLSDGTWTQAGTDTTITFTNGGTALASGYKIVLTYPTEATVDSASPTTLINGSSPGSASRSGQVVTITLDADTTIAAGSSVSVTGSDMLSAYTTSTYAQQSVAVNTLNGSDSPVDYGVALITNDNTTDVTASVPLFVTMAVDGTTINLGTLSTSTVSTSPQTYTFNSNNSAGVHVFLLADTAPLWNAAGDNIDATGADSTISAGTEGYGFSLAAASGMSAVGAYADNDEPFPITSTNIANSGSAAVANGTVTLTYKAAIAGTTKAGSYNQTVTVTVATAL